MKFVKGKKAGGAGSRPIDQMGTPAKQNPNPWIDKRHFDTVLARCVQAENLCKDLINILAVDDGEFLASHTDYLTAGEAIKRGDV